MHHARGGVDLRIESGKQRKDDDNLHDAGRTRDAGALEDHGEGRFCGRGGTSQDGIRQKERDDENGAQVEHGDAQDGGAHGVDQGFFGVLGFGRGDGDDFDAAEGEGYGQKAGRDAAEAIGHEAVLEEDGGADERMARQEAQDEQHADDEEGHDDDDLDKREPILEFAETTHAQQVDDAEEDHADSCGDPRRDVEPGANESGRAGDFGAEYGDGG